MKGWHVPGENVWRFPLQQADGAPLESRRSPQELLRAQPPPLPDSVRNVYELKTKPELVRYYHAAAGFPTKPTWIAAIKNGHYKTWAGLNQKDVAKYFPESTETWQGHGRKIKSGQRSTQQPVKEETPAAVLPTSEGERAMYLQTYNLQHDFDKKLYTDQTERFPYTSFKGNQYVMAAFDANGSNGIFAEPTRNRSAGSMLEAYEQIVAQLPKGEARPTVHILDNECSKEFKQAILDNDMTYQLVPPHDHRRNAAEKAIQIFKDHFVAVLCGTDENFPMRLWCSLLPQAVVQLNMLRPSATNPKISAFEQLHGPHNYGSHPFAILGSGLEVHVMPKNRRTWGEHTVPGFYLGPSWQHYRCHDVWVSETRAVRSGQTVFFKHHHITRPTITTADALLHTGQELCAELKGKAKDSPLTQKAVETLMNIFKAKASRSEAAADAQRVRRAVAMAMRKETEEKDAKAQRVPTDEDDASVGTASTSALTDDEESVVSADDLVHEKPFKEDDGLHMTGL